MMLSDVCLSDVCRVHPANTRHPSRPAGRLRWRVACISSSGPAWPAWLKPAAAHFCCRGGGILWRPPSQPVIDHDRVIRYFLFRCSAAMSRAPGLKLERIDPLRFLAGCRKRRLNHALSVLSLSLNFSGVSLVLLTRATFLCCVMLFV